MSKLSRLRTWLEDAGSCPCCRAGRLSLEQFNPSVHKFEAEALYDCGARVQIWPGHASELFVANGCPAALIQRLDEVEQEIEEQDEDEEEGAL